MSCLKNGAYRVSPLDKAWLVYAIEKYLLDTRYAVAVCEECGKCWLLCHCGTSQYQVLTGDAAVDLLLENLFEGG